MDTYQPIYDAVRSRISNGDIGSAVESALRDAQIGYYVERATGLPVLPQWRERTVALIDAALDAAMIGKAVES